MSEKKLTGLTNQIEKKKVWELIAIIIVTAIVWNLPTSAFGIDGLTVVQQRIIATFVFATLSWLTECIPAWATSLSIITIMCTTVSQNSFKLFKGDDIGELLDSEEIMASFADPIIMLFLAGFILAIAASKSGLDTLLAKNLIRPFGNKSENVLLGFLMITGLFSMFISNTATAALLVPILAVVCRGMGDKLDSIGGTSTIIIGIAVAASTAMCLPISTPPNAIAYSTGLVEQKDMLKTGLTCGLISLVLGYALLFLIGQIHFLG